MDIIKFSLAYYHYLGKAWRSALKDNPRTAIRVTKKAGTFKKPRQTDATTMFRRTHPKDVEYLIRTGTIIYGEWK
jgi:hypothetical protein